MRKKVQHKRLKALGKFYKKHRVFVRSFASLGVLLITFSVFYPTLQIKSTSDKYDLSKVDTSVLPKPYAPYGDKLLLSQDGSLKYNDGYSASSGDQVSIKAGPKFTASFASAPDNMVKIDDPSIGSSISFKPLFKVDIPQKNQNRVVYPVSDKKASIVYTLGASRVKEDIILFNKSKDTMTFAYELVMNESLEPRMEQDGSLGIYGLDSVLAGNVSTGSDKDAELLKNARESGEKSKLIFKIPAPFVVEANKQNSSARSWFSLDKKTLTIHASGLLSATYPLSIDPSVYIETASKLMKGNNETNINFDVPNELIQKSNTTGARINGWVDTLESNSGRWDQSVAAAGGFVYRVGGRTDPTMPYIASQQASTLSTAGTNFVMNMPAVRPAGDLYVATIAHSGTSTIATPSGWTLITNTRELSQFYKEGTNVSGGNEAATYTFVSGASVEMVGTIVRIKNFFAGAPISGAVGTGSNAGNVLPAFPAIGTVPAHDATFIIRSVAVNAGAGTGVGSSPSEYGWLPSGHTKTYSGLSTESSLTNVTNVGLMVASQDVPPLASGAVPLTTIANDGLITNTGTSSSYGASTVAIRPAVVTAGYQSSVEWANIDPTSKAVISPNPGTGTCSGWCNNSAYNLVDGVTAAPRVGMQLISYNGYLYAMGGTDGTARASTVFIAKLGSNGEPSLWHPSGGTPTYWYKDTGLNGGTARSYFGAYAYNNKMYVLGGQTNASPGGVTTVEVATINPNGILTSWSTAGMQALPDVRHGHSIHVYNDVMYLIGGNSNGTLRNTVFYSKINNDGTMNPWTSTSAFTTARSSFGGTMTGLWGAYIYIAGGCSALTSGYCSGIATDVQLASINADGTIAPWNSILNLSNQRIGHSFVAWQNGLYRIGGCNRQNTSTGFCQAVHQDVEYGSVNPDGDASTVNNSDPAGLTTCTTANPTSCDLPEAGKGKGQIGQMNNGIVINNGYIYVIGGCTDISTATECYNAAARMSGNTAYAAIDSTGALSRPSTCSGTYGTNIGLGTITQSGTTTITNSGNNWTSSITGTTLTYLDGTTATVTYVSPNTATSSVTKTVTAEAYRFSGLWCVDSSNVVFNPTITYETGTITQTGTTTITGSGTTWVAGHSNLMLAYEDGTFTKVTRNSNTQLTADTAKTITGSQKYQLLTPVHNTGNFTQSGNTITGVGTTFTTTHINQTFVYNDGTTALITARASNTSITVNVSKTVGTAQNYGIYVNGMGATSASVFNNTIYLVGGTDGDNWSNKIHRMSLNANGTLNGTGTWRIQSMTSLGLSGTADNERGYMYTFARANPASASTNPGNLFLFGGCSGGVTANGLGCNTYSSETIKCNIGVSSALNTCTTAGQLQIDADDINTGVQGLGLMAGTVYANRVYLVGGSCTTVTADTGNVNPCSNGTLNYSANRRDTIYARIDNSNNIVAESGGVWQFTTGKMDPVRRRAVSFGYNGYIYSLAGYSGSASLQDLLFAKINVSTGDMASFSSSGVVVTQRWDLRAIVSNGYVYAIGGCGVGSAPVGCTSMQPEIQTFQLYNNDSGTPVGFTALSDDTYATATDRWGASAAVLNGYVYVAGGCTSATDCTAATNDVQYALISSTDGTIGTWASTTNVLPLSRAWGQLEVAGNTLYYLGGQDSTATNEQSTIYYANTFSSGNITSAWSTASGGIGDTPAQAAQPRTKFGGAVWNSRIYVVGGLDGSAANTNTVYVSPDLSAGGDIPVDSWATGLNSLNVARRGNALVAYNNNLYNFGGYDGTSYFNDSQYASIGYKTGTISQTGTTVTGSGTTWTSAMIGSKLQYLDGSTSTITAASATSLTVTDSKTVAALSLYTILDGSVNAWSYTSSLPSTLSEADGFAYNGYMYLIGGRSSASVCVPNTILAPLSANTTIVSGNNPTGVGDWYETNQKYTGDRYGAAVTYANGKALVLGGGCTAPLASTRHYYTTLKSQPQVAKYSRLIDTDTDVFPTSWLLNGIDNSTGAEWRVKYSTMHDVSDGAGQQNPNEDCGTSVTMPLMTTYGQESNFGKVTLGRVENYNPRGITPGVGTITQSGVTITGSGASWTAADNGKTIIYADGTRATVTYVSATSLTSTLTKTISSAQAYDFSINCARYFYFSINIDSQRSFGYPDDISRGPTIADLTLFFTSDPSKRLRHGKTYTGGEQQPLDSPCRVSGANPAGSQPNCPLP